MKTRTSVMLVIGACAAAMATAQEIPELELEPWVVQTELQPGAIGLQHGAALDVSGDVAVVGRPGETGHEAVDVYLRVPLQASLDGPLWEWIPWCQLQPPESDTATAIAFGSSVAVDGSTVVVGGFDHDQHGQNAGGVWVFELPESPPAVLIGDEMLVPEALRAGDYLGWDVAIDDGVIVIGAWGHDVGELDHAGVAFIFEQIGQEWVETAILTAGDDAIAGGRFGRTVTTENGHVLVAGNGDVPVHHFFRGEGSWQLESVLPVPGGLFGTQFGASLAFPPVESGNSYVHGALIGAPGDGELGPLAGAVYSASMIEGQGILELEEKLTAPTGGPWHRAGASVAGFVIPEDGEGDDDDGALLYGAPGWQDVDHLEVPGAIFAFNVENQDEEDEHGRVLVPDRDRSGLGTSMALDLSLSPNWEIPTVTILSGGPTYLNGEGYAHLVDVPIRLQGVDFDCNNDGRFDAMEVLFEPELSDCDTDGEHDACQIRFDAGLDCDQNGQLDSCQINDDPQAFDCDGNGEFDACQILNDPGQWDCDSNGQLDACQLQEFPSHDQNEDGILDCCQETFWMTEHFDGSPDLSQKAVIFTPLGGGPPHWDICTADASGVWIDLSQQTNQEVQFPVGDCGGDCDDNYIPVDLPFIFTFPGGGNPQDRVFVGTNGFVTFIGGDDNFEPTLADHFVGLPRLAALWCDLDPSAGGQVITGEGPAGSFVVTWLDVPLYVANPEDPGYGQRLNSAQLILHPDQRFEMAWLDIDAGEAIVGPSDGTGFPSDFLETDLSQATDCFARGVCEGLPVEFDERCNQDVIVDGVVDVRDLLELLNKWGPAPPGSEAARCDYAPEQRDQQVNVPDLMIMIEAMREGCPTHP